MPAEARRTMLLQVTVTLVLAEVLSPQRASRPYMYIEGFFGEHSVAPEKSKTAAVARMVATGRPAAGH